MFADQLKGAVMFALAWNGLRTTIFGCGLASHDSTFLFPPRKFTPDKNYFYLGM